VSGMFNKAATSALQDRLVSWNQEHDIGRIVVRPEPITDRIAPLGVASFNYCSRSPDVDRGSCSVLCTQLIYVRSKTVGRCRPSPSAPFISQSWGKCNPVTGNTAPALFLHCGFTGRFSRA